MQENQKKLILLTGLSGAGKSIALNVLEDAGYNCIDNLPVCLFNSLAQKLLGIPDDQWQHTAIGIDARSSNEDLEKLPTFIAALNAEQIHCEIIFLHADKTILMQRFSETRRRHPLTNENNNLEAAIHLEKEMLEPLSNQSSLKIDTSRTNLHELREIISQRVVKHSNTQLSLMLQSFGFKHGMPRNADFVFDARCLPNPHWQPNLRAFTGRDQCVIDFLEQDQKVNEMLQQIHEFLTQWIPCFESEGRSYLTIAIGCTGGQHRSVYLTEQLGKIFEEQNQPVLCSHRELP